MEDIFQRFLQNSKYDNVDKLKLDVAKYMFSYTGYGRTTWHTFQPYGIYRAREHNNLEGISKNGELKKFTSESEFWNTPSQFCKLGRCNDYQESIFYCTNEFEVAIQEIKPSQEYITISHFLPKPKHLQKSYKTAIPIGVSYLSQLSALKKISLQATDQKYLELDNFLDKLFHLDISLENEYLYKLSTAITQNLMSPIRTKWFDVPMQGLVYPSMARDKKGFNIAFRPEHIVSNYYLYSVQTHKVLENNDDIISIQLVRNGYPESIRNSIDEFYNIKWYELLQNGEIFTFLKIKLSSPPIFP